MSIPAKNIVQIPSVNTQQTYGGMGISSPSTSPLSIVTWRQAKILRSVMKPFFKLLTQKPFGLDHFSCREISQEQVLFLFKCLKFMDFLQVCTTQWYCKQAHAPKKSYFKLQRSHMREGPWKSNTLFPCAMCLWASEQSRVSMCVLHHRSDTVHVLFSRWTI